MMRNYRKLENMKMPELDESEEDFTTIEDGEITEGGRPRRKKSKK
jgi:hypothetical protein